VSITSADSEEIITQPTQLLLTDTGPQEVELLGIDDAILDGPQSVDIVIAVIASDDPEFASLPDQTFIATNLDDDRALPEPLMVPAMSRWAVLMLMLAVLVLGLYSQRQVFITSTGVDDRSRGQK